MAVGSALVAHPASIPVCSRAEASSQSAPEAPVRQGRHDNLNSTSTNNRISASVSRLLPALRGHYH